MSYHSDLTNNYQIFIINWLFVLNCKHNKSTNHDNNIIISIPVTVTVPLLLNIQQRWTDLHQDVMVMIWYLRIFDFQNHQKGMISMLNQRENLNSKIVQIPLFSPVTSAQ